MKCATLAFSALSLAAPISTVMGNPIANLFADITGRSDMEERQIQSGASAAVILCVPEHQAVPWYRAYNSKTVDHFYTPSFPEVRNAQQKLGYKGEGVTGLVFRSSQPGAIPFYRLYNAKDTDHFYTTNVQERDNAIKKLGYKFEGITGYIYRQRVCGAVPLYRLYNAKGKDHFYTVSVEERTSASKKGWKVEGIAGYVFTR